jgi:hypothetical protein
VGRTLTETLGSRTGANGIQRFLLQQRLIPVQGVQAFEPALQMVSDLASRDLHVSR